jgi:hypothetical protein
MKGELRWKWKEALVTSSDVESKHLLARPVEKRVKK